MVAAETTTHEVRTAIAHGRTRPLFDDSILFRYIKMMKYDNYGRSLLSFKALRNIGVFLATGTYAIARDCRRLDSVLIQEV